MPYPLPLTRTEAYLAYKAGVIQQSDLKPSLAVPRNGIDAWLAYWTGLTNNYPVKNVGKNLFDKDKALDNYFYTSTGSKSTYSKPQFYNNKFSPKSNKITMSFSAAHDRQNGSNIEANVRIVQYDANGNFISRFMSRANGHTFTLDNNTESFILSVDNGPDAWFDDLQVEYGSTPTAYEPYTDEPLILQEEEAYIAYLCGVINEYPEKCLRRVGAYLRYLISARWGRPDHPLNREELYLSLIKTQFIPSGDPSSDIEIDGTAKAAFVDIKMYGDTAQNRYDGKNLLPPDAEMTSGGITTSWNSDGTLDITGTATGSWPQMTTLPYSLGGTIPSGTQLTLSMTEPLPTGTRLWFREYDVGENTYINHTIPNNGASITFLTSADMDRVGLVLGTAGGTTLDVRGLGIMLEVGDTATSFEPYVGGQPSPSPEYPQPIQTVTGRQVVNVTGKNLNRFPYASGSSKTHRGVTFTANPDGSVTIKGTHDGSGTAIYYFRDFWDYNEAKGVIVDANTTLTASITGGDGYGIRFIAEGYHPDETYDQLNTTSTQTITTTAKATFNGRITVYAGFSSTEGVTVYPMLEKGSTATAYEPYSSNDYEINLGKNLLEPVPATSDTRGITTTVDSSTGEIIMQGKSTQNYPWVTDTAVNIPAGTYTLSIGNTLPYQMAVRLYYDETNYASGNINAGTTSRTVTLPNDTIRIVLLYNLGGSGVVVPATRLKLQLEAGSAATPYAPYFEPIELCKFGAYQDYIWKDGGDWKVHKATANITLNNTADASNWSKSNSAANNVYINQNIPNLVKYSPIVATNLTTYPTADIYSRDIVGICYNTTGAGLASIRIGVGLSGASTINLFKSWLEENPVTAYYALATPADTIITNQTLIDQLEALVAGGAENGTTYIKVNATDPNLPGLLYVEAPKYE